MQGSTPSDAPSDPAGSTPGKGRTEPAIVPQLVVPASVLDRFDARVLDPSTAVRAPGQGKPSPTVYIGNTLIVRGLPGHSADRVIEALQKVAAGLAEPLALRPSARDLRISASLSESPSLEVLDRVWATRVWLTSGSSTAAAPPDAWALLQAIRSTSDFASLPVSLEHVLTACGGLWGGVGGLWGGVGGLWGGVGGLWGGVGGGLSEYGSPGFGGRTPVAWSAPDPREGSTCLDRPPVVALLDTGVGRHPWFTNPDGTLKDGIEDQVHCDGQVIGVPPDPADDPEYLGVVTDPVNGQIDRESGHGTFIAGIIRQRCPQAHILAIPVMPADGAAAEQDVLTALGLLLKRHLEALAATKGDGIVDVLSLSLGYYHETPVDALSDGPPRLLLEQYAAAGIAVVAAAGNDATRAPFFPAALAPSVSVGVPMTSVGALNPDATTVALFSNNGPWITTHAVGAGVVSTVPTTLSGSSGRTIDVDRRDPLPRATVDPDDYSSGFAVWSGTSFAAPMIAGDIAAAIAAARAVKGDGDLDRATCVAHVGDAVQEAVAAAQAKIDRARSELR